MRILSASETRSALPMRDAIDSLRSALATQWPLPQRQLLGNSLIMPGVVGDMVGVKVVSTVPGNASGLVIVFDESGGAVGTVDGHTLTAIRTGAVSGLATDLLAPRDAHRLAILGAGSMAPDQIEAILAVRDIDDVVIWSRDSTNAESLAKAVGGRTAPTATAAVRGADIVCTATPATHPLFDAADLAATVHINAIGAYTPEMVEIPPEFVRDAFVMVEDRAAALAEAGDLIQAGREADATITEVLRAPVSHPRTLFKSVGIATLDVATAHRALANATTMNIGTAVNV